MRVGASADFEGSAVAFLDLSGAKIDGELRLAHVQWTEDAQLRLRNGRASVLHGAGFTPKCIELDGFTYDRIGGVGEMGAERLDRKTFRERYIAGLLDHDPTYTPQPYEQLASVCAGRESQNWHPTSFMRAASGRGGRRRRSVFRCLGFCLYAGRVGATWA